ncbi:Yos1-like protein [Triangularia verruculosa]|uniref:Yos1-like protein n=1 Tax=Triangularia verruculosa TaxID=2587418 RepID=A0AAN6XLA2_9PEZI|nr:Yos1-like protein [Triangularia verruculosa]
MTFLGKIIYVTVLILNAIVVLSEDRFLARVNLTPDTHNRSFGTNGVDRSVKYNAIQLIASIRTLTRIPLVPINILIIVYELVLG